MARYVTYTVDDEDANCGRCEHCCDDFDCCKNCGAEHGWWGYSRREKIEVKE